MLVRDGVHSFFFYIRKFNDDSMEYHNKEINKK